MAALAQHGVVAWPCALVCAARCLVALLGIVRAVAASKSPGNVALAQWAADVVKV